MDETMANDRLYRGVLIGDAPFIRFHLARDVDETGVSGTGRVAEGVQFSNGTIALHWMTEYWSVVFYPGIEHVIHIHGHGGQTRVVWEDHV